MLLNLHVTVAPLKVELHFNDGTVKTIDVGAFIR